MKTAIVLGGTGLVGSALLEQLLTDKDYEKVIVLSRRELEIQHEKITTVLVDFDKIETYSEYIKGDVLFSSLGTTIGKAKTKENQYKIDYTYQYKVAQLAAKNGVPHYVLISSAGANKKSAGFYLKMKGELDEAISQLPFKSITILRPSLLHGDRNEFRLGEKIAYPLMQLFSWVPGIRKYRPIHVKTVAKAMRNSIALSQYGIFELDKVHELAGEI